MSRVSMSDLAYDIEQLYIDGHSPKSIASQLECPLGIVYDWLEQNGIDGDTVTDTEQGERVFASMVNELA